MRIMALDYGAARIGVAVSDELKLLARPLETIEVKGWKKLLERLRSLVAGYGVERLVVGIPYNMDGSRGPAAERAERFARRLEAALGLPVERIDERLTSREAEKLLARAGKARDKIKQKKRLDEVAAAVILQDYLERSRG